MKEPVIYDKRNENLFRRPYVTVDKRFRFSQGAMVLCELKFGRYLHLIEFPGEDGQKSEWYFIIDDDKNGFKLCSEGEHAVAHSSLVCQMFIKETMPMVTKSISFPILKTKKEYKGKKLFKIDIARHFITPRAQKLKNKN